jgi:NADH-ubiquinone oxidoreductase chain 5
VVIRNGHEASKLTIKVLFILYLGAMFSGYFLKDIFLGLGSDFFNNSIFTLPANKVTLVESEFIPIQYKILPLIGSILGT